MGFVQNLGPHASFIIAALRMAALVVIGLAAWVPGGLRAQRRRLADARSARRDAALGREADERYRATKTRRGASWCCCRSCVFLALAALFFFRLGVGRSLADPVRADRAPGAGDESRAGRRAC